MGNQFSTWLPCFPAAVTSGCSAFYLLAPASSHCLLWKSLPFLLTSPAEFVEDWEDPCDYEFSSCGPEPALLGFGAKQWWWSCNSCDQVSGELLWDVQSSLRSTNADVSPVIAAHLGLSRWECCFPLALGSANSTWKCWDHVAGNYWPWWACLIALGQSMGKVSFLSSQELPGKAGFQLWLLFGSEDVEFSTGRAQHLAASSAKGTRSHHSGAFFN